MVLVVYKVMILVLRIEDDLCKDFLSKPLQMITHMVAQVLSGC